MRGTKIVGTADHLRRFASRALWILLVVAALVAADRALLAKVGKRSDANRFRVRLERIIEHPSGEAIILGNSTTGQWLVPRYLARLLRVHPRTVQDGHLSACYTCCSWNVVQQLLAQGRHYVRAFVGLNHYQMCETVTRKRIHQQIYGLPLEAYPSLAHSHAHGRAPARAFGRFLGVRLSDVFADAVFAQTYYAKKIFGAPVKGKSDRWYVRPERKKKKNARKWRVHCDYTDGKTAMEKVFLRKLLDDLEELSDETYLIMLPDRELAVGAGDVESRWKRHRQFVQKLVDERPHVTLIDLSRGKHVRKKYFRDPVHLTHRGYAVQRRAFEKALRRSRRKRASWARSSSRSACSSSRCSS